MKKSLLLCSSILALSAGSMSVMAQDRGGPEGAGGGAGPSAASPGPSSGGGAADRGPSGGATSGGSMGDSKSMDGGADGASGSKTDSGESGSSGSSAKSDMKDGAGDGANKSQAQDRGDRGKPGSDNAKSEMRDDKGGADKSKAAADANDKPGGKDKARADDKSGSDDKSAATGKSEGATGAGSGPKLTSDQRTKVQSGFRGHKDKSVKNLNVSISVGTAIPRSVTLYAVPEEVVVIVPEYRRYKYFIYEDEVVIVDPDTYEIVEVIVLA